MIFNANYKNPLDPNDYIIWEQRGFEEVFIGLFKILRPRIVYKGFEAEQFVRDNARLGISVGTVDGQFFGTTSFLLPVPKTEIT